MKRFAPLLWLLLPWPALAQFGDHAQFPITVQSAVTGSVTNQFNSAQCSSTMTLSNGNATATRTSSDGSSTSCVGVTQHSSGKYLVEFLWQSATTSGTADQVGFGNRSLSTTCYMDCGINGVGMDSGGNMQINGSSIGTNGQSWNGTTNQGVCAAIDETGIWSTSLVWFKVLPSGNWNVSGGNPDTGTSGGALTTLSAATATFTNSSASIGLTNAFQANDLVYFTTSGTLPTNFAAATPYYVISTGLTTSHFEVSATSGGSAIVAGSAGTGTQTAHVMFVAPGVTTYKATATQDEVTLVTGTAAVSACGDANSTTYSGW